MSARPRPSRRHSMILGGRARRPAGRPAAARRRQAGTRRGRSRVLPPRVTLLAPLSSSPGARCAARSSASGVTFLTATNDAATPMSRLATATECGALSPWTGRSRRPARRRWRRRGRKGRALVGVHMVLLGWVVGLVTRCRRGSSRTNRPFGLPVQVPAANPTWVGVNESVMSAPYTHAIPSGLTLCRQDVDVSRVSRMCFARPHSPACLVTLREC